MVSNPKLFHTGEDRLGSIVIGGTDIALRDLFAAFCAAGIIASMDDEHELGKDEMARCAYADADALLAAREGEGETGEGDD